MPCSKETLIWLFYNVSSFSLLLLLFLHFSFTLLLKLLNFIGSYPLIQRNQGYEYNLFSDEEEEVDYTEAYYYTEPRERDHLVADIIHGGESLVFLSNNSNSIQRTQNHHIQEFVIPPKAPLHEEKEEEEEEEEEEEKDDDDDTFASVEQFSLLASAGSESEHNDDAVEEEHIPARDADSFQDSAPNKVGPTAPITTTRHQKSGLVDSDDNYEVYIINQEKQNKKLDSKFQEDERYVIFGPTQLETKKLQVHENDDYDGEIFGDSCTAGSTSKSSSEWRSSIKDSGTDDPFSSSSRRSCPKWESYTVFQKYDEEMTFLDRISAQKLHETESLKSIQVSPRSISDRIVHKITTMNKKPSDIRQNPYHELEAAYVAQICLTWEALNWNYQNFLSKRGGHSDPGCPGQIAQKFQQFQVLLQRYVENEPYEQGRRPEVYARMRLLAPKLLLVPEYRDSEDDLKEESFGSRISTAAFLMIMEEGIRTFMDFLKADKQKPCQILTAFFRRNRRGSVDPALLQLMKKVNKKKKMKLKDLRRARKWIRKRKLKVEEEMEILLGLIDLKVVSRVLRMSDLSEEQLHWCEEKMSKVRVSDGKIQRDSSPLFFPAH